MSSLTSVQNKFDRIDASVTVDKSVDGFSPEFKKGICRVLNGGDE